MLHTQVAGAVQQPADDFPSYKTGHTTMFKKNQNKKLTLMTLALSALFISPIYAAESGSMGYDESYDSKTGVYTSVDRATGQFTPLPFL